ncbi:Ig domain-containing protein [Corynebacterium striatum]|uniref:Ig domain-containing protein n=1 Tax=Corynebacterium striatum TaxID=43770 RepID=UPI003B5BEAB8
MADQKTLEGFNARKARVGMTGAVRSSDLGTAPVPLSTKYDTEKHRNLGYISPDGLEISFDEDKQEYIPWQEVSAIRTDITKAVKSVKLVLWETGIENFAKFLGVSKDSLETQGDGSYAFYEDALPQFEHEHLHIDVVDGDKALRLDLLDAQITERGSMVFKKDEMFGLEVTYTSYPASYEDYNTSLPAGVGKTARWQMNSAWATGGANTSTSQDGVTPLSISTASLAAGTQNTQYSAKVSATGGTSPYTYTVSSGSLPADLQLNSKTGEITGTPSTSGESTFTVKVTDNGGLSATKELSINIA